MNALRRNLAIVGVGASCALASIPAGAAFSEMAVKKQTQRQEAATTCARVLADEYIQAPIPQECEQSLLHDNYGLAPFKGQANDVNVYALPKSQEMRDLARNYASKKGEASYLFTGFIMALALGVSAGTAALLIDRDKDRRHEYA